MNLINLCTQLDIFSLPLVAPFFPFQTWSHHERIHLTMLLKRYVHWYCTTRAAKSEICWNTKSINATTRAAKYENKSLYFVFKFILLSIFYSLKIVNQKGVFHKTPSSLLYIYLIGTFFGPNPLSLRLLITFLLNCDRFNWGERSKIKHRNFCFKVFF